MNAAILPKKNRTAQRMYDQDLYKLCHLAENTFLALNNGRVLQPDTPKTLHPSSL